MTFARRKDANHNEIADHLRKLGWSVLDLSRAGSGVPDMAVGRPGFAALIEVKRKGEKLTEDEAKVRDSWKDCPYIIATSPLDALQQLSEAMHPMLMVNG